jgi:hypothetical protein
MGKGTDITIALTLKTKICFYDIVILVFHPTYKTVDS